MLPLALLCETLSWLYLEVLKCTLREYEPAYTLHYKILSVIIFVYPKKRMSSFY